MNDIIIVGAGASGIISAILCARQGKNVILLDHNDKIGRKLLATGNGKCNFSNEDQKESDYRGMHSSTAFRLVKKYGPEVFLSFLNSIGVCAKCKEGYYYPYSEQATSIVHAMQNELEQLKVKVKLNETVQKIKPLLDGGYVVKTDSYKYEAKQVILSCGGMSGEVMGANGSGYALVKQLGHSVTPLFPALVGLRTKDKRFAKIAGIRVKALARLVINGSLCKEESGELQITSYGISGIMIFQISRFAAEALLEKKRVSVLLQLLPELSVSELKEWLIKQKEFAAAKRLKQALETFFDLKLCEFFILIASLPLQIELGSCTEDQIDLVCRCIKNWEVEISDIMPFDKAQVTAGGVLLCEVDMDTMESKFYKGLYLTGELLDVDGACGGYNLQWAFSSGYAAAMDASNKE